MGKSLLEVTNYKKQNAQGKALQEMPSFHPTVKFDDAND